MGASNVRAKMRDIKAAVVFIKSLIFGKELSVLELR